MKSNSGERLKLAQLLFGAAIVMVIALVMVRGTKAGNEPVHLTTDWTHRHLVFSAPKSLRQSFEMSRNSRYVQQFVRRNAERKFDKFAWAGHHQQEDLLKGDWSMDMGAGATVGDGNYPAKFSFDATSAKCGTDPNPDFVVYNTSIGNAAAAKGTGTFTGEPTTGQTITITNGVDSLILTAGTTNSHTSTIGNVSRGTFARNANPTTQATNLRTAITTANNGSFVGVTATSAAAVVTVTATATGTAGNSIALTEGSTGFAWAAGTLTGGTGVTANIGSFDNLYTGCGGTVPSVYWAYNTGGTVVTSPTISYDGTQVAFVQNVGTTASLVLLKWAPGAGTFAAPTVLTTQASAAAYRSCTAPCMYTMAFTGTGTLTDTNSSPFYDFNSDMLFAGSDGGQLQKFTGVFNGTPAHVTTGGFPVTLTAGNLPSSPVYDETTGKVYIADGVPAGMGNGQVYSVDGATGAVVKSVQLSRGVGFHDGVLLDSTNNMLYLFTADNTGATCPGVTNAVISMPTNFTAATPSTFVETSNGNQCSSTLSTYAGDFDNAYYSGGAGHLYVCGNIGAAPTLFQVAVSATGVLGAATSGPALAASGAVCGPVVEMFNPNATGGAKDWIFTSVQSGGVTAAPIHCPTATGCIMSFDVTSGAALSTGTTTAGTASVAGGASGVVFDNSVGVGTLAGTSQVYFTPLTNQACTTSGGTGGCAIQASQANLN